MQNKITENFAEEILVYWVVRVLTYFNLAATNLNFSLLPSSLIGKEKGERMLCTMISEESLQGQSSYDKLLIFQMFPFKIVKL